MQIPRSRRLPPGETSVTKRIALALLVAACLPTLTAAPAACAADGTQASAASSNPGGDQPAFTSLDKVEVKGHFDNAVGTSDAASQGVIRGEIINDIPLLRPGEALETVPGMVVTQHSGDGKANQYFLRGCNLDHGIDFATTIDHVPANMPTNAHGQGYSDVNYLIPELVDRINYRKGPYFAENGDFSSAGSADIQYKRRLDHGIAEITAGDYGFRRILLANSRTVGSSSPDPASSEQGPVWLGAAELQRNDGPWTTPEQLRKTNALLRLSDGSMTGGWSVDAAYYDAQWRATDQVPLEMITSGQLGRFSAVDPFDGGNTRRYILAADWHDSDESSYRRISAFAQRYLLQLWSNFTLYENDPVRGDQMEQAENRNLFGLQAVQGWTHQLLGRDSTTELGVQLRHDRIDVSLNDTEARTSYLAVTDDQVRETAIGIYAQNSTAWTPWLRTSAGLRADSLHLGLTSRLYPANDGTASGSRISPKLSVILGPWAKTEVFVNVGRGFHSNDARGVINKFEPGGAPAEPSPVLVGSTGKEIGLRTEVIDGLQSSVALWSLNSSSEILYSADAGGTEAHGPSRRYGLEWNNHWIPNKWSLLDVDLAWSHSRFADENDGGQPGKLIPNAVSKVAMIRYSVHDLGPWSAGVETRYIGGYPLTQDGSLAAPSAIVTNLRVRREVTPRLGISLDILNLFDRQYFDIAYAQDYRISPASAVVPTGVTVHPGEPRQLRLSLHLKI